MNYHLHVRSQVLLFVMFLALVLLTTCAGEQTPSPEERQAAAAATVAAARATEVAAAQIQAELTRAAIPSATPTPTETLTPSPTPTATDSNAISKEMVAAEGGSIELSDGTRLEIPPGALATDGKVSIARLDVLPSEAGNLDGLQYQAYEISAPTHTLAVSATITFSYQGLPMDDALAPDAVFAAYWDGQGWELLDSEVDPTSKTLSFETEHFSIFSVFLAPTLDALRDALLPPFFRSCYDWFAKSSQTYPQESRLSQLTAGIAASNAGAPASPVYRADGYDNFAAYDKVVVADIKWFDGLAAWLPKAKRDLLLVPILAHELSHVTQGYSKFTVAAEVLAKSIGMTSLDEALREALRGFYTMILAIGRNDCEATFESSSDFLTNITTGALSCAKWHEREIAADEDGVVWAAKYATEKGIGTASEVGLIYAHFFEEIDAPSYCSHPAAKLRADQAIAILGLGQEGGIYGKVTPAGVEISVDRKLVDKADENGQFLVTGLTPGNHNIQFSKAGFQTQSLPVDVPSQRLMEVTQINLKAATPTPNATAIPKRTPAPSRPGLITDFENWGTWKRGDEAWGTFTQSKEQVYAGSYSGKLTYSFPATSNNYLVFRQTISIAGQPVALRIMVYGDGSGNFLNAWVQDANGQLWQFTFGQIYHTGWQQMGATLDVSRGWPNQAVGGNPKTVAPVYPLRFSALVLDGYREDAPFQGVVYVDDLLAGDADKLTPIPTTINTPTPVSPPNPSISFRADRTSLSAGECTTLRWDVDNVTAVYLDSQGVAGHESRQICPTATQTYNLAVTRRDGSQQQASVTIQVAGAVPTPISPPSPIPPAGPCEAIPGESYGDLSIQGTPSDRPAESHADLNLAVRGYERNNAAPQFSDYGPAVDPNGPQLPGLFGDQRTPRFTSTYQVFDWDWGCNCRSGLLNQWDVTLLGMAVSSGEAIRVPDSGRSIGSGYEVLVLYASSDRITLKYTPEDNVVSGYTIHIEDVCVEPNLLGLYQSLNQSGRGRLPALRAGQAFGRAKGGEIKVAIRDGGAFFDPRSRNDWWRGR